MATPDTNGGRGLPLVPEAVLKRRHDLDGNPLGLHLGAQGDQQRQQPFLRSAKASK